MEINLESLRRFSVEGYHLGRNPQARMLIIMLDEIYKTVDLNEIIIVYPKNLFVGNKQVEIYLFADKEYILKVTYTNKDINTFLYFYKNIIRLENKVNSGNDSRSLTIEFFNGDIFEFNSVIDTNLHHSQQFDNLIVDIFKLLSGYKKSNL